MYTVTKRMEVSAAHHLVLDYESKCEHLHGHNWIIYVTCQAEALDRNGMVVDFKKIKELVHAKMDEMGMTAASATAMKLIYEFRPRYLIMVGIAAGIALDNVVAEQMYGDVVVPNIVWNYSAGKFVSPDKSGITFGDVGFQPKSTYVSIPEEIMPFIKKAVDSEENECHVHIGHMACGSTVVATRKVLEKQIHSQLSSTVGLDMESYAVVYAAYHAPKPRPVPIIVKSVCDFANSEKSDEYQKFAAYTSCEFAKLLYEKFLPMD